MEGTQSGIGKIVRDTNFTKGREFGKTRAAAAARGQAGWRRGLRVPCGRNSREREMFNPKVCVKRIAYLPPADQIELCRKGLMR